MGESLLPASIPILEELGVHEQIANAGFLKKWGATMVWGQGREPWSWRFEETNKRYPHAYQVLRAEFDSILLDNSARLGAKVYQNARVTNVDLESTKVTYRGDRASHDLACRFIIDASGQSALIGNRLGTRQWDTFFKNLAVYGYFENARRLPEPNENNIFIEAHEYGWCWIIPLSKNAVHKNWASVGVVLDAGTAAHQISDLKAFMFDHLAKAPKSSELLIDASLVEGPYVARDWSYSSSSMIGEHYLMVGDAACFVDPLFSSGVHLAMNGAVLAAAYVSTLFEDPALATQAAAEYEALYRKQYNHFYELAKLFYASNRTHDSYFWETRRLLDKHRYSPRHAFIRAVAGQPPQGYERVVLDKGELPEDFTTSLDEFARVQDTRNETLAALGAGLIDAVLELADAAEVVSKALLDQNRFIKAQVLRSAGRPDGVPCSPLVAAIVARIDGRSSCRQIIQSLIDELHTQAGPELEQAVLDTVSILVTEGMLELRI